MTISLAFLAPNLVRAAIEGRLPHGMGVARLCKLPAEWSRQHYILGVSLANSQILAKRIALPEKRAVTQFRRLLRRLSLVARCDRLRAHPTPQRVWTAIRAARNGSTKTAN
jgi:hypothetical protein